MLLRFLSSLSSVAQSWSDSATPWTAARQASLSITSSQNLVRLMSIESVMPSNHLILCRPLSSCLQSFPASGSFPVSQLFASGGQSIGASASVLQHLPFFIASKCNPDVFQVPWPKYWPPVFSAGSVTIYGAPALQHHCT